LNEKKQNYLTVEIAKAWTGSNKALLQ